MSNHRKANSCFLRFTTISFVISLFRCINSQCTTRRAPEKGETSPRYLKRLQFYLKSIFTEIHISLLDASVKGCSFVGGSLSVKMSFTR